MKSFNFLDRARAAIFVSAVLSGSELSAQTNAFTDVTPVFSGSNLFNAKWGDFDNDNDLDLHLSGTLYRNDGGLVFTAVASVGLAGRKGVHWADYDRDGDIDFLRTTYGPGTIFRNDGSNVFVNINAGLKNLPCGGAAWGDYDNDGRPDVLLTGAQDTYCDSTPFTALYRNNGGDSFSEVTGTGLPSLRNSSVAWGDFDNDGDLDLLLSGLRFGPIDWIADVFRNNGNGTFTPIGAGFIGGSDGSVDFGDYDEDGHLDALVTGFRFGEYLLRVYHNNGNGTFTESATLQGNQYGDAQWVDFNNDGHIDILSTGCVENGCDSSLTILYRNNADGTFSNANVGLIMPAHTAYPAAWGDYDNDGDLDLSLNRLFRNNATVSNSPPTAPSVLIADQLGDNTVMLRWNPSSDNETTNARGLSYAVRVGTFPGACDYLSTEADFNSGYRRVPQRGPLSTNACLLRDVPRGTYYWSVQAIDGAFAGSAFAAEGTFAITNERPFISAISNQMTVPGRTAAPIAFTISDFETAAADLTLNGTSSNQGLVQNASIVFGGSGSNRTATITPTLQSGTTKIEVYVTDAYGLTSTSRFDLVIETFTVRSNGLPGFSGPSSAWGDYDNDGDLDLAFTGPGMGYTTVYRNDGATFSNQNFNLPNRTDNDLAWVDYDNDGDLDLVVMGFFEGSFGYSPGTYVFRNNGTNSFTTLGDIGLKWLSTGSMAWGDYDRDGDFDVLLSGDPDTYHSPNGFTALYRNQQGMFTNTGIVFPPIAKSAAAWADYDGDGDLDLLMSGLQTVADFTYAPATKLYRNDGNETFVEMPVGLPALSESALAFADYDNDGDLDLALSGLSAPNVPLSRIYRNDGGSFIDTSADLVNVRDGRLVWGDYDADGFVDLLLTGSTTNALATRIYHNDGGLSFTDTGSAVLAVSARSAGWGDADNDGDLDLLLGSRLYRNNWGISNSPPAAPTGLSAFIGTQRDVNFSWAPSTDLENTNAAGLSYNLRIGTVPGGVQKLSPHADVNNGYRRIPALGSIENPSATVFNLTNGTYYWSVQAIDSGLAGSSFALEGSFVISAPVIAMITNRSIPPNATSFVPFTVSDAETAGSNLVVTASSSDTNRIPNSGLVISGSGTNRTLAITPATNQSGTVTIALTVVDESNQGATRTFTVTIERFQQVFTADWVPGYGVAWGDFDRDGDLDLASGGGIYRNDGSGGFVLHTNVLPAAAMPAWGDYDRDGDLDLVMTSTGSPQIYRNDGGFFVNINASLFSAGTRGPGAWGDTDKDGDLDLLVPGSPTRLYRNSGSSGFTSVQTLASSDSVSFGDFDRDGDLDILLAGGGNNASVVRNDFNGTFFTHASVQGPYFKASGEWGDFDMDGDLDFVVTGFTNTLALTSVTRVYRNSAGSFTNLYAGLVSGPHPNTLVGINRGSARWGDYDNDGDLDLAICGQTASPPSIARIYRNESGVFSNANLSLPGLLDASLAWGDFDNDGNLDVASSGLDAGSVGRVFIHRNVHTGPTNVPPGPPVNLTSSVTGKVAGLRWEAAADANQTNSLSYVVRVGTAPGQGDIVPPMSLASGRRLVAEDGNTRILHPSFYFVRTLPGGTYYWSVQTIDASFASSAFATEGTFVVSNLPPIANGNALFMAEDSSTNLTVTGSDPDGDALVFSLITPPSYGTLSGGLPNVTYTPFPHFFGLDQFVFRVYDGTTSSVPASMQIQVTPLADLPGTTLGIQESNGQIQLSILAEPWATNRLEASQDLLTWVTVTNLFTTNLLQLQIQADVTQFSNRFYRAVSP